jgi:hypothetical protein
VNLRLSDIPSQKSAPVLTVTLDKDFLPNSSGEDNALGGFPADNALPRSL